MSDEGPSVMNSELAVDVLDQARAETYSQEVAEALDTNPASVRRTVNQLHDIGFLEKTKRNQAQYFRIDYDGLARYWREAIMDSLEAIIDGEKFTVEEMTVDLDSGERDDQTLIKIEDGHHKIGRNPHTIGDRLTALDDTDLRRFMEFYVTNYLKLRAEPATLDELLFTDMYDALVRLDHEHYPDNRSQPPEELRLIREALLLHHGLTNALVMKTKISDLLTAPDFDREDTLTERLQQIEEMDDTGQESYLPTGSDHE